MKTIKQLTLTTLPFLIVIVFILYFSDIIILGIGLLMQTSTLWVTVALIAYLTSWLLKAVKWRLLLPRITIHNFKLMNLIILGNFISLILPAKSGDIARLRLQNNILTSDTESLDVIHDELSKSSILSTVLVDRIWDLIGIMSGGLILLAIYNVEGIQVDLIIIVIIGLLATIFVIYLVLPKIDINKYTPNRIQTHVEKLISGLSYMPIRYIPVMIFYSILIWTLEGIILRLLLLGIQVQVPLWVIIIAVFLANITKVIPITPGGFVLYESTIGYTISSLTTVNLEIGIAFGIMDSIFKNGFTLIWGFFSYLFEFNIIKIK